MYMCVYSNVVCWLGLHRAYSALFRQLRLIDAYGGELTNDDAWNDVRWLMGQTYAAPGEFDAFVRELSTNYTSET